MTRSIGSALRTLFSPWLALRALPKNVWALSVASLINRSGTMVLPFLLLYLTHNANFSAQKAAAYFSLYGSIALLTAPVSGWLCDRMGVMRLLRGALLSSGLVMLCFPLLKSPLALAIGIVLLAFTTEAIRPSVFTAMGGAVKSQDRKAAFALLRLAINIGMGIGPMVGGYLATRSFRSLFLIDGLTTIAASGYLFWAIPSTKVIQLENAEKKQPLWHALKDRRAVYLFLALIPVAIVYFQHESTLALYMVRTLGLPVSRYGSVFTVNVLLIILFEVPLNLKMAHWKNSFTFVLGALLIGIGFGGMVFATTFFGVALATVVWTFGEMVLFPALSACVADLAPPGRSGIYMGMYTLAFNISFVTGPYLGVLAWERWGGTALWLGCGVLGIVSAILFSRTK